MDAKLRREMAEYRRKRGKRWQPEKIRAHRNADAMLARWAEGWELPSSIGRSVFPHVCYRTPTGERCKLERVRAPVDVMRGDGCEVWWYRSPVPGVPLGWFWKRIHQNLSRELPQRYQIEVLLSEALRDPEAARAEYEAHAALSALGG